MSHGMQPPPGADADVERVDDDIETELQQSVREACGGYGVVGSALHAELPTMPDTGVAAARSITRRNAPAPDR